MQQVCLRVLQILISKKKPESTLRLFFSQVVGNHGKLLQRKIFGA